MASAINLASLQNQGALDLRRSPATWNSVQQYNMVDAMFNMVAEQLRANANEGFATLSPEASPSDNLYLLPEDYIEMRFAEQVSGDFVQQITPAGISAAHSLKTRGSTALSYLIYSQADGATPTGQMVLQLIPANGQDINIDYWQLQTFPIFSAGSATNPVLQQHFQLCLWGYEALLWQSVQNWEQRDRLMGMFQAELDRINKASNAARYGAGAARGSAARFYNNAPSRAM